MSFRLVAVEVNRKAVKLVQFGDVYFYSFCWIPNLTVTVNWFCIIENDLTRILIPSAVYIYAEKSAQQQNKISDF